MPCYLSSKGYGVLVNTSRYPTSCAASFQAPFKEKLDERIAIARQEFEKTGRSWVITRGWPLAGNGMLNQSVKTASWILRMQFGKWNIYF